MDESEFDQMAAYLKAGAAQWKRGGPERIVAFFAADDLGGFICQNIVCASIVRAFPGADVMAVYREALGEMAFIADCNPCFLSEYKSPAGAEITLPLDWFDIGVAGPVKCPDPEWTIRKRGHPDLLLTPGLLSADPALVEGLADAPPSFRLPLDLEKSLIDGLAGIGLERKTWFVCFEASLEGTEALAAGVAQAGGHAVDLSTLPFELQAAAISRARFVLATEPPIAALASAFCTPVAALGVASHRGRVWNKGDVVLAEKTAPGIVEHMLGLTQDCPGWRGPARSKPPPEARGLTYPLDLKSEPLVSLNPIL